MKTLLRSLSLSFILCLITTSIAAQYIRVQVIPDHTDWLYKPGEKTKFTVNVLRNEIPVENVEIRYEISEDTMDPRKTETITLKNGTTVIDAGTMKVPGFLRCRVWAKYDGKEYDGLATSGYNPQDIKPVTKMPADFTQFWDSAKIELRKLPLDSRMTLIPEKCTDKTNAYYVNFQNINNSRMYGVLYVPKAPGKYPAILRIPGAGIRSYVGDAATAEKGVITLEVGIHGIPVNLPDDVYNGLTNGALRSYGRINLDNRDTYYYKRVILGCIRAIDFIYSLPEFDGERMAVRGSSQGGALTIATAALDNRVKSIMVIYPAMCDMTAYLYGRAGGWPHMFKDKEFNVPAKIETSYYYDVVNFSRLLKVPGFYSLGYNDRTCPPTSMYAALNSITAPKTMMIVEHTGHSAYNEQWLKGIDWLLGTLNVENPK